MAEATIRDIHRQAPAVSLPLLTPFPCARLGATILSRGKDHHARNATAAQDTEYDKKKITSARMARGLEACAKAIPPGGLMQVRILPSPQSREDSSSTGRACFPISNVITLGTLRSRCVMLRSLRPQYHYEQTALPEIRFDRTIRKH